MRNLEEIYQALLASFAERAGFAPEEGCDLAVRLWAAAAQIQALEIQADWVLEQSFPQTAQGEHLDHHGALRGVARTEAVPAKGVLRFSVSSAPAVDIVIPAGSVCMTEEEVRFRTTEDTMLKAGTLFADAPAEAVESGSGGNAIAGTVNILTACPVAVTACTNPAAFSGGSDRENDESFRQRILDSYRRLPNGANAVWYRQTALNCSGVAAASVVGRARGIGTVDVYIAAESGLPPAELLEQVRKELRSRREIAVDVEVKAPAELALDIALEVLPAENAVETAVRAFFSGSLLGKPVRIAQLADIVYRVEGVENYRILSPETDVSADDAVLPVLGTLTVTEMEA